MVLKTSSYLTAAI